MAGRREGRRKPGWSTAAQEIVHRLFVYGTLRSGQHARSLVADHVAASQPATMPGAIYAFPEGYPGFVAHAGDGDRVVGELLELRDLTAAFLLLDAYEGDDFQRILAKARTADGDDVWCWVYALTDPEHAARGQRIASGDWSTYRS